ncbi:hypothetical protein [Staphylococcus xylosus]|nr:hypothetical protein [Staphylococcus xylosus]AID42915.1 hypothetical protein SXYLSMQ121_1484 [Staphylococcus xylosus]RIM82930.1 hypothetical protein BU117_09345 [Staphylococcus xylosus]RIM84708.1 hypothetical protein BU107_13365 [Staphylococcus xylosus]WRY39167.1 hypothetical protein P8F82_07830 [Staphylococcus xylosus]
MIVEKLSEREMLEDLDNLLEIVEASMKEKSYKKALIVKNELNVRFKHIQKLNFEYIGNHSFHNYCNTIIRCVCKTSGKWYEHTKDPYTHYIYKLDEIRIELTYYLSLS